MTTNHSYHPFDTCHRRRDFPPAFARVFFGVRQLKRATLILATIAGAAVATPVALADTVHLKDGRRLEGRLLDKKAGVVRFERPYGSVMSIAESRIVRIEHGPSPQEVFAAREKKLAEAQTADGTQAKFAERHTVAAWLNLVRFGRRHHMTRAVRRVAGRIVRIDPDHTKARRILRHRKVGAQWLPEKEARRRLGLVRYRGEWLTKDEVKRHKQAAIEKRRFERLQRQVNRLAARLASRSRKTRDRARDELVTLAEKKSIAGLANAARNLHTTYDRYWTAVRLDLNLQHAQLRRPIRTLSLSLGRGAPVRVELPELRRVGVGGTVSVPAGR